MEDDANKVGKISIKLLKIFDDTKVFCVITPVGK